MTRLIDRLPILYEIWKEDFCVVEANAKNAKKDADGCCTAILASSLRGFGIAEYILHSDVKLFQKYLTRSVKLRMSLFERADNQEKIASSYLAMLSYEELFSSLAVGDFELAKEYAMFMGGRSEIEKEFDHSFDNKLGYTLKYFVLMDSEREQIALAAFIDECNKSDNEDFQGYANLFQAIHDQDLELAEKALSQLAKGHVRQSKRGVFKDTDDEMLSIWGVGMVNLARSRGLILSGLSPLIPDNLLTGV